MQTIRLAQDRGHANHGWLDTWHTFSFASYQDPDHVEFGPLRVINEDFVAPGTGFGMHGHRDMEIITYVLEGALEHRDSLGNGSVIRPGEVQRMSAGTGIQHSERNPSADQQVHLLQIWIKPDRLNLPPSYEQKTLPAAGRRGRLQLIASRDAAEGSVVIHQDARVYAGLFTGTETATLAPGVGRQVWVQLARGNVSVNGTALRAGDGLALTNTESVRFERGDAAEILVFDLPGRPAG